MMGYPDMTSICFTLSNDDTLSVSLSNLAHLIAKVHENSTIDSNFSSGLVVVFMVMGLAPAARAMTVTEHACHFYRH